MTLCLCVKRGVIVGLLHLGPLAQSHDQRGPFRKKHGKPKLLSRYFVRSVCSLTAQVATEDRVLFGAKNLLLKYTLCILAGNVTS